MNAMPLSAGIALKNFVNASSPPAEAPIPTTGKPSRDRSRPLLLGSAGVGESGACVVRAGVGLVFFFFAPEVSAFVFSFAAMPPPR